MTKYKTPLKRKKRVFIDIEYINEKDLEKSIKEIFLLISQGIEKEYKVDLYKNVELMKSFKQWYTYSYRDIKEISKDGKLIHLIKGSI